MKHEFITPTNNIIYKCDNVKGKESLIKKTISDYLIKQPGDYVYHLINGYRTQTYVINPNNGKPSLYLNKSKCYKELKY